MNEKTIDFLRATFSDKDFLEEQSISLIHKIVLGLNGQALSRALEQQPLLTDAPDDRGNTPLIWAAIRGDDNNLLELLKHGADVELRNDNGWNASYAAVNHSRLDCTSILLSYGYQDFKDGYGMTALHRACQQSDPTYVQLLLEHDVNVNEKDIFQRCPLALAAWRNNAVGVAFLLQRRADREVSDIFGASPLLRAVQYAAVDAARVLLESGCNVLAVDHEMQTLLHRAALSRDIPTIELLAEKRYNLSRIDINAKDKSGKTAKQRLQTLDPSANLLAAFAAMISAIENAQQMVRTELAYSKYYEDDLEVLKDAIEYQSDDSPVRFGQDTHNKKLTNKTQRRGKARLAKSISQLRPKKGASKYQNTFSTMDRHPESPSVSSMTLLNSSVKE